MARTNPREFRQTKLNWLVDMKRLPTIWGCVKGPLMWTASPRVESGGKYEIGRRSWNP